MLFTANLDTISINNVPTENTDGTGCLLVTLFTIWLVIMHVILDHQNCSALETFEAVSVVAVTASRHSINANDLLHAVIATF